MILSLVIAAPGPADAAAFVDALRSQGGLDHPEVEAILTRNPDAPAPDASGLLRVDAPTAVSIFELWGQGLARAKGDYAVFLDLRCPPRPGWLVAMLAKAGEGGAAYFGPVACDWPPSDRNSLGYLVEYVQFDPPLAAGLTEVPGVNVAVRRALAQDSGVSRADGFVKTRLLSLLAREGLPAPEPVEEAVVGYRKTYGAAAYRRHRFRHARCYAAERATDAGVMARLSYLAATPLLPVVRTLRIVAHAQRARRAFALHLVQILAAETAWAAGEFMGYVAGESGTRARLA
ncbi:hypothetical protein [Phenylobacterium sp.]|uniref:hypothetical protein n=1 Tax=Phenylobacterium sp. TaxID=1871053 RepID=UPI002734C2CC|nr:hypothetical protein [Phenylobacterium sp.]MDP3659115.1 hypothetical protein [Phenylobacterium sp.]